MRATVGGCAMDPDPSVLPTVRQKVEAAIASLHSAHRDLESHGFQDTAKDLHRTITLAKTWTDPDGYLHHIEKGPK